MSAALLRVLVFAGPLIVGFLAGTAVARTLTQPTGAVGIVVWWAVVIGVSTAAATAADHFARRLLPLAVLLQMTMVFPDRAPSRLRVARRTGNVTELRRRIAQAQGGDGDQDLGETAEMILSLAADLSRHDRRTRGHAERTRAYTELLAEELGLPEDDRDKLRWAALLHDVGKLVVPGHILNKDGALDDDEWEVIKQHPVYGMELIQPLVPWLGEWAQTVEHHHERWDGSGYPYGLHGSEICLGARIVSVADAYDVMTSGRAYKKAMTPAAAREEVAKMAGRQFDPMVARALMNISLGKLRWATGPLAVLAEIPFIGGLERVSRDLITVFTSSAVMATSVMAGVVAVPAPIESEPVVEIVIAGAGLEAPHRSPNDPNLPGVSGATEPGTSPTRETVPDHALPLDTGDPIATQPPATAGTTAAAPAEEPPGTSPGSTPTTGATTTTTVPGTVTTTLPPTTPPTSTPGTTGGGGPTTTTTTVPGPPPPPPPPAATPPSAGDDTAVTPEDTAATIGVLANDSDPEGNIDPSSVAIVGLPAHGSVTTAGGDIRYSPSANWSGSDAFRYRVCDTTGLCSSATVSMTVTPVNDPPTVTPMAATTAEETLITIPLSFSDIDGDTLRCTLGQPPAGGIATVPANCTRVTYQPLADFFGSDSLRVDVFDGTVTVPVIVSLTVMGVNDPPTAVPDTATTDHGSTVTIPILANDSDPDGDPLVVVIVSPPSRGTVSVTGGGTTIRYTPKVGAEGRFTFTYRVCDPAGLCDQATVTVTVTGGVVAIDDTWRVKSGKKRKIEPAKNDYIPDGVASISIASGPVHGTAKAEGKEKIAYTSDPGYVGPDQIVYEICDKSGSCDTAIISITVRAP